MPAHLVTMFPAHIAQRTAFTKATMVDEIGKREKATMYRQWFNVKPSSSYKEEKRWIVGLGMGQEIRIEVPDGLPLDGFSPSYAFELIHGWFANSVLFSKPFIMHETDAMFAARSRELVKSLVRTMEFYGAQVVQTVGTTNGPDGVPYASASHPLRENILGASAVVSNLLNVTMDHDSMQDLLSMSRRVPNERGVPIQSGISKILVADELYGRALEIWNSRMRSDTAEGAENQLRKQGSNPELVTWPYIMSPTFWQAVGEDHSYVYYIRQGIQTAAKESFENWSIAAKGDCMFSCGIENWRHIFHGHD